MLFDIMKRSFANQKKAMALMIVSIAVGTALAASLITISFEIEGKVSKELRSFGANIIVEPKVEGLADTRRAGHDDIRYYKDFQIGLYLRHGLVPPPELFSHHEGEKENPLEG